MQSHCTSPTASAATLRPDRARLCTEVTRLLTLQTQLSRVKMGETPSQTSRDRNLSEGSIVGPYTSNSPPRSQPRMDFNKLQYLPLALPRFSLLAGIFLVGVAWIEVRGLRLAYSSIGLGGAVMPGHLPARPVPGVGIALAVFVPPLSAVAIALLISRWQSATLAYTGGSVGRLIGADLLTLNKVQGLTGCGKTLPSIRDGLWGRARNPRTRAKALISLVRVHGFRVRGRSPRPGMTIRQHFFRSLLRAPVASIGVAGTFDGMVC
jgi:hypothetical protein